MLLYQFNQFSIAEILAPNIFSHFFFFIPSSCIYLVLKHVGENCCMEFALNRSLQKYRRKKKRKIPGSNISPCFILSLSSEQNMREYFVLLCNCCLVIEEIPMLWNQRSGMGVIFLMLSHPPFFFILRWGTVWATEIWLES